MARERGTFNFSASLEIKKEGALDARQVVQTKAELILPETWIDEDSKVWLYKGLITAVVADTEDNNGIYFLKDKDTYTNADSWAKVASLKAGASPEELQEAINNALEEAKQYVDTKVGNLDFSSSNYVQDATNVTEAVTNLDNQAKTNTDNITNLQNDLNTLNSEAVKGIKVGNNKDTEAFADGIITIRRATENTDGVLDKNIYYHLDNPYVQTMLGFEYTNNNVRLKYMYSNIVTGANTISSQPLNSATTTQAGLLSAADKTKLDNIPSNVETSIEDAVNQAKEYADATFLPLSGGTMAGPIGIPYNGIQTLYGNRLIFYDDTQLWFGHEYYRGVWETNFSDLLHRKNDTNYIILDTSNFVAGFDYLAPGNVTIADISDLGSTWDSYLKAEVYDRNITINGTAYPVMTGVSGATAINIYAPNVAGTPGQFLKATGNSPTWANLAISDISGLQTDGDGSLYLANDGTYKEVSALSEQEIYTLVPSTTANEANASVYTLVKNNSNVVVVYKDNGLFFPISWKSTTGVTVIGSAVIYDFPIGAEGSELDNWISYDIDLNSEGVCYCTQRSLTDSFKSVGVFSFQYSPDNAGAIFNEQIYPIIHNVVGYTAVAEIDESGNIITKHIGKITKTPDNVTIVCTEGNTQITYVCTPDGNMTKQEDNITIDWSNIGSKPSTFTPSTHTHTASQVTDLATVATSGSYNDLSDKPSIPSAYTLPIATSDTLGGIRVGGGLTISGAGVLSATGGGVADSVDIENVEGLNSSWLALLQTAPTRYVTADPTWEQVSGKPVFASVATSGSYDDLTDKPTIPSLSGYATQSWVNSQGFLTSVAWDDIQSKPSSFTPNTHTHPVSQVTGIGTITFTGAVSATYNGTQDISVNIPTAGGGVADSVDWSNVTNKPNWIGSSKPTYSFSEISGTIAIGDLPTGTTGSTVALGNHTHSNYLTSSSLSGYATQSWVQDQGYLTSVPAQSWSSITGKPSWIGSSKPSYSYSEISGTVPVADLPIATTDTVGVVRIGAGLTINSSGVLSATGGGTADAVDLDNITGMNSAWKTLLASAPTRYVTSDPTWSQITEKPNSFTPSSHTHSASDITSGTLALARIPTGTTSSTVALGNHTHETLVARYSGSGGVIAPSEVGTNVLRCRMMYANPESTGGGYCDWLLMNAYTWSDVPYCTGIGVLKAATPRAFIMSGPNSSDKADWNRLELATQNWVTSQGYLTSVPSTYATQSWVTSQINGLDAADIGAAAASHTHVFSDITFNNTGTNRQYLAGNGTFYTIAYSELSGTPDLSNYASSSHTHGSDDIVYLTGYTEGTSTTTLNANMTLNLALASLQNQIQTKQAAGNYATESYVDNAVANVSIDTSGFVTITGTQTISGAKTFTHSNGVRSTYGFYDTSDIRLKSNIQDIELKDKINLYEFDKQGKHSYGVIAQEVEQLYPSVVNTDENGYKTVNYNEVLSIKCAELEAENKELKARLDKLEALVNSLL